MASVSHIAVLGPLVRFGDISPGGYTSVLPSSIVSLCQAHGIYLNCGDESVETMIYSTESANRMIVWLVIVFVLLIAAGLSAGRPLNAHG